MRTGSVALGFVIVALGCTSPSDPPGGPSAPEVAQPGVLHTSAGDITCTGDNASYVCPRAARGFQISPVRLDVKGKSPAETIEIGYGSYLVNAASDCASCHSSDAGFLAGGNPFPVDHAGHVVFSRNLTPDPATGMALTEDQFVAAMRTGRDFHAGSAGMLVIMPWLYFRWASLGDLHAIYAYLRAIPPVANTVPPDLKAGLGLPPAIPFPKVYDEGEIARPLPPDAGFPTPNLARGLAIQPLAQPSHTGNLAAFARGSYLANSLSECGECHTQGAPGAPPGREPSLQLVTDNYMTGGNVFTVPPPLRPVLHETRSMAANLTGAMYGFFHEKGVDFGLFDEIIRTQTHADETPPRPIGWPMPAANLSHLLEPDLRAIFTYARHVPPNTTSDLPRQDYARWCASDADCNRGETCHQDADPAIGNECVGKTCAVDADCDACQTCGCDHTCQAPTADSACIQNSF